jgi:hypothetical protein
MIMATLNKGSCTAATNNGTTKNGTEFASAKKARRFHRVDGYCENNKTS